MEIVNEAVSRARRLARPGLVTGSFKEASPARERVAAPIHVCLVPCARGRGHGDRELLTDCACRRQQLAVRSVELLQQLFDQLAHRVGHVAREGIDDEIFALHEASFEPGIEERRHEEGIATRTFAEERRDLGDGVGTESRLDILRDGISAERADRDLGTEATPAEFACQTVNRMVLCDRIAPPVRANHEQARRLASSGERVDQVDRRGIGPLQVFEDEHERVFAADRLERLEHLSEHPLGRCPDQAAVDGLELVVGEEPRHLRDPGRRLPRQ